MTEKSSFTGRSRRRRTTWRIRFGDLAAKICITLGGAGTIVAVLGVLVFLVSVVLPLAGDAKLEAQATVARAEPRRAVKSAVDETRSIGWSVLEDGELRVFHATTGAALSARALVDSGAPAAMSFSGGGQSVALGFADGTVRLGRIEVETQSSDVAPGAAAQGLATGATAVDGEAVLVRAAGDRWKTLRVRPAFAAPQSFGAAGVIAIDHVDRSDGHALALVTADGLLHVASIEKKKNLITRKVTSTVTEGRLQLEPRAAGPPQRVLLSGLGDNVFVIWADGNLVRIDTRRPEEPLVAEELDLVEGDGRLTALEWMNGRNTMIAADSRGALAAWFRVKPPGAPTHDGALLVRAHELPAGPSPVVSLTPSTRSRLLVAGHQDGSVQVFYVTTAEEIAAAGGAGEPATSVILAPKEDGLYAIGPRTLRSWALDAKHPDATARSLFTKVWYEGEERPAHVWQSSSGSDDFEPKLGLAPLVFGTAKATLYSLVFGVPIALLAAIFTSEFMHPRVRAKIKPTVELMASLPSVVLGFIAGMIVAPFAERFIAAVLVSFLAVPLTFLAGAYVWQLLPARFVLRADQWRIVFIGACLPIGCTAAFALGPAFERLLFAGDVKGWLHGTIGGAAGGWFFLFLPCVAVAVFLAVSRTLYPAVRRRTQILSRTRAGLLEIGVFAAGFAAVIVLDWALAAAVAAMGFDPRGAVMDTYDSRNALVVGLVMGFAVIPIIYTIAEDALSTVPEHLRAASLGAGATRWQTAVRIVIPAAMSGLFSAVMVGLGRAVGETMIVLMAAGNTPVMSWNIFNGFRTLSANIATELPEAVRGSSHYRTLFAAALTLLVLTFVLNTVAEIVRQRFRRRAVQL
jgi:phosphate transport system permease protein